MSRNQTNLRGSGGNKFWTTETLSTVRDLTVLVALLAYVIGFVHHSALLEHFGMQTDLIDQPLTDLLQWALIPFAIHWELWLYLGICVATAVVSAWLTRGLRARWMASFVPAAVLAIGLGSMLSTVHWLAQSEDYQVVCHSPPLIGALVTLAPGTSIPSRDFTAATAGNSAVLVGKTNDAYQLALVEGSDAGCTGHVFVIERSRVQWIEYVLPPDEHNPSAKTSPSPSPVPANPNAVPPDAATVPPLALNDIDRG